MDNFVVKKTHFLRFNLFFFFKGVILYLFCIENKTVLPHSWHDFIIARFDFS